MLTPQQRVVLSLVSKGMTEKEVAEELRISQSTVKRHYEDIRDKLGAENMAQSIAEAFRQNILN